MANHSRLHPVWRIYCIVLIILILYNEVFIYVLQKFKWSSINCKDGKLCHVT